MSAVRRDICPRCHNRGWYRISGLDLHSCDHPDCAVGADYRAQLQLRAVPGVGVEVPPTPQKRPEDPQVLRRVIVGQLRRRGEVVIARALEAGNVSHLSDREQAVLDAAMTGTGFLVEGKRVDPDDVVVFQWST